jgi:Rieske Fe-S protein
MKRARYVMTLELRAGALRSAVAALLAGVLSVQTALAASGSAFPKAAPVEPSVKAAAMRQKVLKVQLQSMVVVKLKNKEQLRGRLTEVADENFTVKVLQGENFVDRKLAYSEVKSFRPEKSSGSTVKKVILYSAIAGAVLTVVAILGLIYGDH